MLKFYHVAHEEEASRDSCHLIFIGYSCHCDPMEKIRIKKELYFLSYEVLNFYIFFGILSDF